MHRYVLVSFVATLLLVGTLTPAPAKIVRDWLVWCDETLRCTMQTDNADQKIYAFGFVRGPKANAPISPFLATAYEFDTNGTITFIVDGKTEAELSLPMKTANYENGAWNFPDQPADNPLLKALMGGSKLQLKLVTKSGKHSALISLSGVTGSALYMDEAQRRLGKQDALQAVGDGEPSDAESRAHKLVSADDLPEPVLKVWSSQEYYCSDDYDDRDLINRFGGTRIEGEEDANLYILPCGTPGAYNQPAIAIVHDGNEKLARRLYFPTMTPKGPSVFDLATNASWDPGADTLNAFAKGRGLGDCGLISEWKWAGFYYAELILINEKRKDECDGKATQWPKTWPLE